MSTSVTAKNLDTIISAGTGTMTIVSLMTLSTTNQHLTITSDDMVLQGNVAVGQNRLKYATTSARTIGIGTTTLEVDWDAAEFASVASSGLTIGSGGINKSIKVVNIHHAISNNTVGTVTLIATADDSSVQFITSASTFYGLAAQADNGIDIAVGLTATVGILYMDADKDDASDASDKVTVVASVALTAETILTLEATTGSIVPAGALSLTAGAGIVVLNDMQSTATGASAMVINADQESTGDGTLTLSAGKTIMSNDSSIVITAWDMDIAGSITAATKPMTIHGAQVDQTIGLGATPKHLSVSDAELGRMTATGGLTVGSTANGSITVDGLTDGSTGNLGRVVLRATGPSQLISFASTLSAFNKGVTLQSAGGVVLSASVTTKNLSTTINPGTGTLTVLTTMTLSTTNQHMSITSDDIDLIAGAAVSSGTGACLIVNTSPDRTIGLGSTAKDMQVTDAELGLFTTGGGLTLGDSNNGSLSIDGVTTSSSDESHA